MSWHPKRAFTLGELLISSALIVLTLVLTMSVMLRVLRYSERMDEQEAQREKLLLCSDELARLCRSANRWLVPAPGDNALKSSLDIEVPHLAMEAERWPWPLPDVSPTPAWNPRASTRQSRLVFSVVGEGLQRRLTQGGSTVTQRWAENVQGLSVQRISTIGVRLGLTYRDARGGLHPLETVVQLRLPRAWRAP